MMDKPAIPLSSSSFLSTVSSVHSQQCNAAISQNEAAAAVPWGAPGVLRKWGSTVAVHGAHQMYPNVANETPEEGILLETSQQENLA